MVFDRIWSWWAEKASAVGVPTEGLSADWTPPRRELYDPQKETASALTRMRAGLLPPQEAIRLDGYEPDEVLKLYREWNQSLDKAGVVLDSDPRKTSGAGLTQARPIGSTMPPTGEPPGELLQEAEVSNET
jgi:capsid protein